MKKQNEEITKNRMKLYQGNILISDKEMFTRGFPLVVIGPVLILCISYTKFY